jgi:hypothetical protein
MHFTIAICCAVAMLAVLCLFAWRLVRAIGSGKRWSPRRRAMCTYTAILVFIQVNAKSKSNPWQHATRSRTRPGPSTSA